MTWTTASLLPPPHQASLDLTQTNFSFDSSGFSNGPAWDWQIVLSGSDLVLEAYAVPEPSSTALLGLGSLALLMRRKRS